MSSMLRIDFSSVTNMHFASFLFREMMRIRPQPPVALFSNLLNAVVKMDQYTAALSMFDEMRQSGAPMNVCTMNIVINCYCLLNRVDLGFAMVGSLLKLGYVPDAVTFTTLIKRLCVNDKVIEAEQLFTKLLLHNLCDPDGFMITTLVTELCKGGYTSRACDILKKRSLKPPSVYAYSIANNSLCKDGMVEDALELVGIMIDKGIPPDVIMYNSILHGLCNAGRWKDVVRLSEEMINRKVSFNVITFNILVNALCKEGEVEDARHVVEIMIRQGISPNIITYNTLIHGYCVQGEMNKAKEMFHSIVDDGLKPDMFTYSSLIKGYCKKGKVDEAWQLFNHMEADQKVDPSVVTCNILLNGLLKDHQIVGANAIVGGNERKGIHG